MFGIIAIAAFVALVAAGRRYVGRRQFLWIFGAMLGIDLAVVLVSLCDPAAAATESLTGAIVIWIPLVVGYIVNIPATRAWNRAAAAHRLTLETPFAGVWRVAAGGAHRATNHHQIASDQRFAYDFVRVDGATLGSPILAPIAGRVVACSDGAPDHTATGKVIEDPNPFGNYIAIQNDIATVFLAHLQCGSVAVAIGETVHAGAAIARCGNSGRTSGAHLHLHAQLEPEAAPFRATGVPIGFRRDTSSLVLQFGQKIVNVLH